MSWMLRSKMNHLCPLSPADQPNGIRRLPLHETMPDAIKRPEAWSKSGLRVIVHSFSFWSPPLFGGEDGNLIHIKIEGDNIMFTLSISEKFWLVKNPPLLARLETKKH